MAPQDGSEPVWKVCWLPALIAVITGSCFFYTILVPQKAGLVAAERTPSLADPDLSTAVVLDQVEAMEPIRLLRDAQSSNQPTDDAVGAARHLIEKDKYNVRNLMCVGNVFTSIPDNPSLNKEGYELLHTASQLAQESKYVRLNYARALVRGQRYEEAIVEYEDILKTQHDIAPSLELARLYLANGDEDKAIKLLQGVLEKDSGNASARKLLGVAMARNHDEKGGFEEYLKAFAQEQMAGRPDDERALVEKNNGSLPKAVAEERALVKDKPTEANRLALAEMLIFQNQYDETKSILDDLAGKNDKNADIHRIYVELYHQQDKADKSYQEWLEANKREKDDAGT